MTNKIQGFKGEYRFLSNFYPSPIEYNRILYPTVEHAYQALKTIDMDLRRDIAKLSTPGKAKRVGQDLILREGWSAMRVNIMNGFCIIKFCDVELKKKLLATGDAYLEETNKWNDTFWGVCEGKGQNHLGKILMEIRDRKRPLELHEGLLNDR